MEHVLFSNGDTKGITWAIKTENSIIEQNRIHADIYLDKVTRLQSKYIALHVAMFWGIGTFLIKNQDVVRVALDNIEMFTHLSKNEKSFDEFIEKRTYFIKQLIDQRNLKILFELIEPSKNLAIKS